MHKKSLPQEMSQIETGATRIYYVPEFILNQVLFNQTQIFIEPYFVLENVFIFLIDDVIVLTILIIFYCYPLAT